MQTEPQQEKLLSDFNTIYHKLDQLFFYIEDNNLSQEHSKLLQMQLTDILGTLNSIKMR
jgi:hypothetical protein